MEQMSFKDILSMEFMILLFSLRVWSIPYGAYSNPHLNHNSYPNGPGLTLTVRGPNLSLSLIKSENINLNVLDLIEAVSDLLERSCWTFPTVVSLIEHFILK